MRTKFVGALAIVALLVISVSASAFADHYYPTPDRFNHSNFREQWLSNELGWGPVYEPARFIGQEDYVEAPGGVRAVQYFDKTRMEDRSYDESANWRVTNGLLVAELVTGMMQVGDNDFVVCSPSDVHVAGDPGQVNPLSYGDFKDVFRNGGYSWGSDFAEFMSEPGRLQQVGLASSPVMETVAPVDGVMKKVYVQLGERQALTYTPDNAPEHQVQFGNVGQHYFEWRYVDGCDDDGGTTPPPPPSNEAPKHGQGKSLENCTEYQVTSFTVCAATSKGNVRVNGNVLTFTHERGPLGEAAIAMEIHGNGAVQISGNPVIRVWSLHDDGTITCDNCRVDGKALVILDDDVESIYIGSVGPVGYEVTFTFASSADELEGTVFNP